MHAACGQANRDGFNFSDFHRASKIVGAGLKPAPTAK
jgi:hypothetical protein